MRNYDYKIKWLKLLTPEIVSLLTRIHEYKGEQTLFIEAKADTLTHFVEIAKMQSIEESNKIEGIYTSGERLKSLVFNKTTPRTRNEQEIAGYRDVLTTIYESYDFIPVKPSIILQLHRNLYKFSGKMYGGFYKDADNSIGEESDGYRNIRFTQVSAFETPGAIDEICSSLDEMLTESDADPLLIIPMFILDFLCIHPFNDGNGRMSRLLTLLLLYRAGYTVGKYISIEKLIGRTKEAYYEALERSSMNWYENKNDYAPFVQYMLEIIVSAYSELSSKEKFVAVSNISKPGRIRETIKGTIGKITKTEIMKKCPDISQVTVQRALAELIANGEIIKIGGGRYTAYTWNHNKEN